MVAAEIHHTFSSPAACFTAESQRDTYKRRSPYSCIPNCHFKVGNTQTSSIKMQTIASRPIPGYYINAVNINVCGRTIIPDDVIFVSWTFTGAPEYDGCFAAVRPISNLHHPEDDNATVAEVRAQCGGASTNIRIPRTPLNTSFPFDGQREFIVRLNTNIGIYADSCTFRFVTHSARNGLYVNGVQNRNRSALGFRCDGVC